MFSRVWNPSRTRQRNIRLLALLLTLLVFGAIKIGTANSAADSPLDEVEPTLKSVEAAGKNADDAIAAGGSLKKELDAVNSTKGEDGTVKAWELLTQYLKDNAPGILKKLTNSATELTAQDTKITDLVKKLESLGKPDDTKDAIKKLKDAQEKTVKDRSAKITKANEDLKASADGVYKAADSAAKELPKQIETLTGYDPGADATILLKNLPAQLLLLNKNIALVIRFDKQWPALDVELKKISNAPPAKPADAIATSLKANLAVLDKLDDWLGRLKVDVSDTRTALFKMREALDEDLSKNAIAGMKLLGDSEEKEKIVGQIIDASEETEKIINASDKYSNATRKTLADANEALKGELGKMPQSLGLVREGLAGNFEDFVADFVPLYNFTDVYHLIKILNPEMKEVKDASALREEAEAARRKVDKADLDLINLRAVVAELQTRVRDLEDELKQANNALANSTKLLTLQNHRLEELQGRPDADPRRVAKEKQRQADLEQEKAANQAKYDELNDASKGLPAQIKAARDQMLTAQQQARAGRSEMVMLAQIESDAFAAARDNERVFYALNNVASRDPIKQLIIYGFSSRKVIYLRGKSPDIQKAKEIISLFDRPAPQARITLRTLELSSTADRSGARHFSKALKLIEDSLSNARSNIAAALSYLRDCINEEVNALAIRKLAELESERNRPGIKPARDHENYVPDGPEDMRWARMFFYQTEVLMRLGFDPEIKSRMDSRNQSRAVNRFALPDPAATTTLGESLVILSLANPASRYEIMQRFSAGIGGQLAQLGLPAICREPGHVVDLKDSTTTFATTKRLLGADFKPYYKYPEISDDQLRDGRQPTSPPRYYPPNYALTSMQKELVAAITKALVPRLITRLAKLQKLTQSLAGAPASAQIDREITDIQIFLWDIIGVGPAESAAPLTARQYAELARKANILRTANAQVARADLMLKQMIDAVNEDVNRHFMRPILACMRQTLVNDKGIGVGIINETSVLATNRLVARVDPRSSAQLSIGDQQDALAAAQQLANLYLAAQTGGLIGGLAGLGGVRQPDTSEVYGLTSGSVFKVNPVFDPTGQTLRFQFDYVGASMVTDPDNSINPQLPRIERHTVNTEVELNNLELREISRFESNARLGIPTTYGGGLPIIKDIPYVKYIPLIGWFTRRSGQSAVIQQSLMLGQTTMYPTIADIFDLLNGDDYFFANDLEDSAKAEDAAGSNAVRPSEPCSLLNLRLNLTLNLCPPSTTRPTGTSKPASKNENLNLQARPEPTPPPKPKASP